MPRGVKKDTAVFCGTGRRKTSIARVRIMPGKGNFTVVDLVFGIHDVVINTVDNKYFVSKTNCAQYIL